MHCVASNACAVAPIFFAIVSTIIEKKSASMPEDGKQKETNIEKKNSQYAARGKRLVVCIFKKISSMPHKGNDSCFFILRKNIA